VPQVTRYVLEDRFTTPDVNNCIGITARCNAITTFSSVSSRVGRLDQCRDVCPFAEKPPDQG
jgi:hypothetical protein